MEKRKGQESNPSKKPKKPKKKTDLRKEIEACGFHAFSGKVADDQMKITELELAHDGIYFWHYLFTSFGQKTSVRPYYSKDEDSQKEKYSKSRSQSNQESSSSKSSKFEEVLVQPSVDDHKRFFHILKLNTTANSDNIFSLNEVRNELDDEAQKKVAWGNKDISKKFCQRVEKYLERIIKNMEQFRDTLPPSPENNSRVASIRNYRNTDFENPAKAKIRNAINGAFSDLCEALIWEFQKGLLNTTSEDYTPFLKSLFCEKSFLQNVKFTGNTLNSLIKKYSQLSSDPNTQSFKSHKTWKANVVTANLYIKYKLREQSDLLYQYVEIDHHDKSAFSRSSFSNHQIQEFDEHIQKHYKKPGSSLHLTASHKRAPHDSEKALMMSLFGYILADGGKEDDQSEENNKIDRIKHTIERLKAKLLGSGVKEDDSLTIQEIGLQFFSIRQYCFWCESYLSHEFKELYEEIKECLENCFKNISISLEDNIKKYGSYSFTITEEEIGSNENRKDDFIIDHENMKSYFSEQFLIDTLTNSHKISEQRRSYFVNDPSKFPEIDKIRYIQQVSEKAEELNKKRMNIQAEVELMKTKD